MPVSNALSRHYNDVTMSAMVSQIPGASIVYSTVCSGADQRKHQSSASLAFVRGIHRWPVNSSHKGPVTRKMFPFDDVVMTTNCRSTNVRIPLAPTTKIRMARVTLSFDLLTGRWVIFVPHMNIIHEIGDVTTEWLWGYRPRSKAIARDTSSHASDQLCQIGKEPI